jgi:hypothetical protein
VEGHKGLFPSPVSAQSHRLLPSTPVDLRKAASYFPCFPDYFNPSIGTSSITLTTSSRSIRQAHPPHLPPPSIPSSRLPQVILHNGYTWSNQRCKDKSCVFRILCAQMPIPVSLSVRSHIGCSYLFWPLRLLTPRNPSSIPLRPTPCLHYRYFQRNFVIITTAIDDPRKVVKVVASDGKTGDTRDISYTNCKVIGNGSFGVVFQAKLVSEPESGEDIAIKKVLQDKRFKVSDTVTSASLVFSSWVQKVTTN